MTQPLSVQSTPSLTNHRQEEAPPLRVLIAGAEQPAGVMQSVRQWAAEARIDVAVEPDLPHAVRQLAAERWDVVVAILDDGAEDNLSWWVDVLRGVPTPPRLIAATRGPSMALALHAERLGVSDLLPLPLRQRDFLTATQRLRSALLEAPTALPDVEHHAVGSHALVGRSAAMLEIYKLIARVGPSAATVLLQGESGTGKEVAARAIHLGSPKAAGPFVTVNCAAIPENLLESELFGHEKGAFTDAIARRIGRVEQAASGTLFLDEIADMSLALQAKILRALQEREIERLGGDQTIPVDVRVIAATNRDLRDEMARGRFREDLYYRLAVVTIRLPTLAERGDDLVLLAAHFIRHFAERYHKRIDAISTLALDLLRDHAWVGNVRELRNVIERAVTVAADGTLRAEHLPEEFRGAETPIATASQGTFPTLVELEARHITRVLAHTSGQIGAAAEILGIHRNTLTRKMREYGL